jgi:lipid-A-disaccharide synthase
MIVAGEVSGDIHAANLLHELRTLAPDVASFGVGGDRLIAEGLEPLAHTRELAHMGLAEVVRELPRIRRILNRLVESARERTPAAAVLVDSPDFNLRLARHLKQLGIPVVLYVSPQLWAWRKGRVRVVRRVADEMLCILPFEVDFYKSHGVPARFVGHPLVDDLSAAGCLDKESNPDQGTLALLPGSRVMEVRTLLPAMLDGVSRLQPKPTEIRLIEAPGVEEEISQILSGGWGADVVRVQGAARRAALARSQFAWTASGTATLECALLRVPMIVGYRLHPASYFLARMLVRVPHVALVNLIAGERLAPELIQGSWNGGRLAEITMSLGVGGLEMQRTGLARVRKALGPPGASARAARVVAGFVGGEGA